MFLRRALRCNSIDKCLVWSAWSHPCSMLRTAARIASTYHCLKIALKVKRLSNSHAITVPGPALSEERLRVAGKLRHIFALGELEAGGHPRAEHGRMQWARDGSEWARAEAKRCETVHSGLDGSMVCRDLESLVEVLGARAISPYVAETSIAMIWILIVFIMVVGFILLYYNGDFSSDLTGVSNISIFPVRSGNASCICMIHGCILRGHHSQTPGSYAKCTRLSRARNYSIKTLGI